MVTIIKLAQYAQYSDDIKLDLLLDEFLRSNPVLADVEKPDTENIRTLAVCASFLELFAIRYDQKPPNWTSGIGALEEPYFIQPIAITSKWFREWCFQNSPEPLKKRNIYATDNYLMRA
jgi:hypothetical protein